MIYNAYVDGDLIKYTYHDHKLNKLVRSEELFKPITGERINYSTDWSDIYGKPLKITQYGSIKEYKRNTYNKSLYGDINPIYQFLSNKFKDDESIKLVEPEIWSLDIEVYAETKFPRPEKAEYMINAVTIHNMKTNKFYTWGLKDYTPKKKNHFYRNCVDEITLIECMLNFIEAKVDILTGFNLDYFDIPYIFNRASKMKYNSSVIPDFFSKYVTKGKYGYKIKNLQILDYQIVYKKYGKNLERFSLDFICKAELGKGKIVYNGKLHELYNNDHDLFIEYNVMDVQLIYELELKLKNFTKIFKMINMCRCLPADYTRPTQVWDARLYWYLNRDNILPPPPQPYTAKVEAKTGIVWEFANVDDDDDEGILGGWVSDPIKGLHKNILCRDIRSSYPHQMMEFNISQDMKIDLLTPNLEKLYNHYSKKLPSLPERITYFSKLPKEEMELLNKILVKEKCTMTPNLMFYRQGKQGLFSVIVENMFGERFKAKENAQKCYIEMNNIKERIKELENGK